jgi:hypothetical protein
MFWLGRWVIYKPLIGLNHFPGRISKYIGIPFYKFWVTFFEYKTGHVFCEPYWGPNTPFGTIQNKLPKISKWIIFK